MIEHPIQFNYVFCWLARSADWTILSKEKLYFDGIVSGDTLFPFFGISRRKEMSWQNRLLHWLFIGWYFESILENNEAWLNASLVRHVRCREVFDCIAFDYDLLLIRLHLSCTFQKGKSNAYLVYSSIIVSIVCVFAHEGFLGYGFSVGFHQRRILIQFDVKQAERLPVCKQRRLLYLQWYLHRWVGTCLNYGVNLIML